MNPKDKPDIAQAGAQLLHSGNRMLFRHWETVRAERACPSRQDINLRAISKLMPFLAIIEMDQGLDLPIFKLAGTGVCELFQRPLTGEPVAAMMEKFERRLVTETLILALEKLQPCLVRLRFLSAEGPVTTAEFLALPVFNTGLGVTQLICGVFSFAEQANGLPNTLAGIELIATRMIWTEHVMGGELHDQAGAKTVPLRVIQGGRTDTKSFSN